MGSTRALIMAGGKSERMRATAGRTHKALVRVHGTTLLEWNVRLLLNHGFSDIVVAVSSNEPELSSYVLSSIAPLARRRNATVSLYVERTPLGNAGAARDVIGEADNVLMLYVDNLATIDPTELVETHERGGFAVTIATHEEQFQIPYGQLTVAGDRVVRYVEKPTVSMQVSSGSCVLSQPACALIPTDRPIGASELFALVVERGLPVGAFHHNGLWIDINDARALDFARQHVDAHFAGLHGIAR